MKTLSYVIPVFVLVLSAGCSDRFTGLETGGSAATSDTPFDVAGKNIKPPDFVTPRATQFDINAVWPLCGRITEDEPLNWSPEDGCPADRFGNAAYTDFPLSSTFGPRQKASEDFRYDYHRGIDIPTDFRTPLFAIADGKVNKAGVDSGYYDPVIQLEHLRPGQAGCQAAGCYYSNYLHVEEWVVDAGEQVTKGQLVGYSGVDSKSDFAHLHFEIRNSPGSHDPRSNWSRDTIHPLSVLPYFDSGTSNLFLSFGNVDTSAPGQPDVTVEVAMPNSVELDLQRIEVRVYERTGGGKLKKIAQPGDQTVSVTPEGDGYVVDPPSFDMVQWNRHYSYKDSQTFPYSVFETGGAYESPYDDVIPDEYDAAFHLDHALAGSPSIGEFNGAVIEPYQFNADAGEYRMDVKFTELAGPSDASRLCVAARAQDARGTFSPWIPWGNCGITR